MNIHSVIELFSGFWKQVVMAISRKPSSTVSPRYYGVSNDGKLIAAIWWLEQWQHPSEESLAEDVWVDITCCNRCISNFWCWCFSAASKKPSPSPAYLVRSASKQVYREPWSIMNCFRVRCISGNGKCRNIADLKVRLTQVRKIMIKKMFLDGTWCKFPSEKMFVSDFFQVWFGTHLTLL